MMLHMARATHRCPRSPLGSSRSSTRRVRHGSNQNGSKVLYRLWAGFEAGLSGSELVHAFPLVWADPKFKLCLAQRAVERFMPRISLFFAFSVQIKQIETAVTSRDLQRGW